MTTIYLVETGEYSDRDIVATFSEEQKAANFVTKYTREAARYFPIELDREIPNLEGLTMYMCQIFPGGDVYAYEYSDKDGVPTNAKDVFLRTPRVEAGRYGNGTKFFRVEGWFRDKEHATKVTAEKYAKHIYEHPESRIE
jgi:hypothetical protein